MYKKIKKFELGGGTG
jgi:hypothetical protein